MKIRWHWSVFNWQRYVVISPRVSVIQQQKSQGGSWRRLHRNKASIFAVKYHFLISSKDNFFSIFKSSFLSNCTRHYIVCLYHEMVTVKLAVSLQKYWILTHLYYSNIQNYSLHFWVNIFLIILPHAKQKSLKRNGLLIVAEYE